MHRDVWHLGKCVFQVNPEEKVKFKGSLKGSGKVTGQRFTLNMDLCYSVIDALNHLVPSTFPNFHRVPNNPQVQKFPFSLQRFPPDPKGDIWRLHPPHN